MKLLIAGSRSIAEFNLEPYIPSDVELIIAGGASGIDAVAEKYADKHKISKLILRPKYSRYGKGAPLKRNEEMIEIADSVLVIWDGRSRGTNHTITKAREKSKSVTVININE